MFEKFKGGLITLSREERIALVKRMSEESKWNMNFGVMLGCSVLIAGLGLLQNSTAVVIGAMLVAPLMTPLIAAGLALVQGNTQLLKEAGKSMLYGSFFCLIIGVILQILLPGNELTPEIEARGMANILDLLIAFFAGIAAAYAVARPKLSGALPGVAISVALVPPLAACGIAMGNLDWYVAGGAGVLFMTNLIIIILAAALVFRLHGLSQSRSDSALPSHFGRVMILLVINALLLSAPLGYQLNTQLKKGQVRPATFPLNLELYNSIYNRTLKEKGIELIVAVRSGVKREYDVFIVLSAEGDVSSFYLDDMEDIVQKFLGNAIVVELIVLKASNIDQQGAIIIDSDAIKKNEPL